MKKPRKKMDPPESENRIVGYARVSTREQTLDLQIDALKAAGVLDDNMHVEKVSAVSSKREALDNAIRELRPGDVFVVWRLDRLARNIRDLLARVDAIQAEGATFKSLTEAIDLATPAGKLMFTLLGAMAQFERDVTIERTKAGMAATVRRGTKLGRKKVMTAAKVAKGIAMLKEGYSKADVARALEVAPTTIANYFDVQVGPRGGVKIAVKREPEK